MKRRVPSSVLAGLAALALAVSAVGPCHCLVSVAECHPGAQEADAHACCERPAGVQAAADECCDIGPELVLAPTDVPDVTPPSTQITYVGYTLQGEHSPSVLAVPGYPPPSLDRTTVLLI